MPAKKGNMAKETILVNREAWMSEIARLAIEKQITKGELNALVAPGKGEQYISTVKTESPRIDATVVRNLGKLGADLNKILSIEEAKSEPGKENDTEIVKSLSSAEKRLETLNDQMGTVIELLSTMINIWRGTDHADD